VTPDTPERRQQFALRDAVQDLLDHVRMLSRRGRELPPEELDYAQERLEWLADEVWRTLTEMESKR
jgi:hypothetical protein